MRPVSQLVSPHLKPTSPRLESSLYARRMRLIRKRASVFRSHEDIGNSANNLATAGHNWQQLVTPGNGANDRFFNHPTNHYDNLSHAGKSASSAVPPGVQKTPVNNLKSDFSLARLNLLVLCANTCAYLQSGAAYHSQGFEDKSLGCSPGLLGQ